MHYPDSRWQPRCQGKSRDDVSGRIEINGRLRLVSLSLCVVIFSMLFFKERWFSVL